MSSSIRTEKVAQTIRETLMGLLLRDVSDPRLRDVMVTDVKVSKDLHLAWVYYDVRDAASLDPKKKSEIEKGFKSATSFFRKRIGQAMASKFTPELRFSVPLSVGGWIPYPSALWPLDCSSHYKKIGRL